MAMKKESLSGRQKVFSAVFAALCAIVCMVISVPATADSYKSYHDSDEQSAEASVSQPSGSLAGHDYVDLGLSVKWATCNVGAASPSAYGNYYAWGEIAPKSEYTDDNCKTWGKNLGDISGNSQYDAARANWGGSWRMPTSEEIQELVFECTWTLTTQGGHRGYKVTGPNGNFIFLPAAGWCRGSSSDYVGKYGYYWSSSPDKSGTQYAYYLSFSARGVDYDYRYIGRSVRPVSE